MNKIKGIEKRNIVDFYKEIDLLQKKYNITDKELIKLISKYHYTKDNIPISILATKLSSFEAIVKYLRENCNMSFKEIGALLNRSIFTIASSYRAAKTKYDKIFEITISKYNIPTEYIASRRYSVLESIVIYLKQEYNLRFYIIAELLNLNQRTIWTIYNRALKKH